MPGGIIDLKFIGSSNIYLTNNPQITFFKNVYKKYSNFSMEYIELPFKTLNDLNSNNEIKNTCNIDRNADLVKDMYLLYDLPAIYNYFSMPDSVTDSELVQLDISRNMYIPFKWVKSVGNILINEVSINLNGQSLSRLKGEYMEVYNHISMNKTKKKIYDKMVNSECQSSYYNDIYNQDASTNFSLPSIPSDRLQIPLNFWFCKNSAFSLPLVALQYTLVKLEFIFSRYNYLFKIGNPLISPMEFKENVNLSQENQKIYNYITKYVEVLNETLSTNTYTFDNIIQLFIISEWQPYYSILANYIFLDDDERKFFAQTSHEYLIEQTQYHYHEGLKRGLNRIKISLNHPVIELIWYLKKDLQTLDNNWFNFTSVKNKKMFKKIKKIRNIITNLTESDNDIYKLSSLKNLNEIDASLSKIIKNNFINLVGNDIYFNNRQIIDNIKWDNYSIMNTFKLQFNGNDRFKERHNKFFELLQIYKYHSGTSMKGLYNYSFSLEPENIKQPSGCVNMSRISKQEIELRIFNTENPNLYYDKFNLHLYSVNYNIFRIIGGIGQIVFSN